MSVDKKGGASAVSSKQINARCRCGTGRAYADCCERWHSGLPGANPEELMRSRYTAFALQNEAYLRATWHRSQRPRRIEFNDDQIWLSLSIVDVQVTSPDSAEVEFIARSRFGESKLVSHHERSQFVRDGGRWFYVDGLLM